MLKSAYIISPKQHDIIVFSKCVFIYLITPTFNNMHVYNIHLIIKQVQYICAWHFCLQYFNVCASFMPSESLHFDKNRGFNCTLKIIGAKFSFPLDIPQKLKEWEESFPSEKILSDKELRESLQNELDKYINIFDHQIPQVSVPEGTAMNALEEFMVSINALLTNPEIACAAYASYNRLSEGSCNPAVYNSFVPLCIKPTTKEGLRYCLSQFVAPDENLEHLNERELSEQYSNYVPRKEVKIPNHGDTFPSSCVCLQGKTIRSRCFYCGKGLCSKCPVKTLSFPQLSITGKHVFCGACAELMHQECTDLWLDEAIQHVQKDSVHAALGCITMAILSGGKCDIKMFKCLKAFYKKGFSLTALPLMVNFIQNCTNAELLVQARFFLASMLQYIARKNCSENGKDNLFFLLASARAFTPESIYNGKSSSIDFPNLPRLQQEVQSSLDKRQSRILSEYKDMWDEENWPDLFNAIRRKEKFCFINAESNEVFKKFITDVKAGDDIREEEKRNVFLFLRAVLDINEKQFSEGVEKIETAIWNHHSPVLLQQEAVALMIQILPHCLSTRDSKALLNANTLLDSSSEKLSSRIANLAFAMAFELKPPTENILSHGTLNFVLHIREDRALTQLQQGLITKEEVAREYVNLMQSCNNYSQNIMCHLLASLWYLQHLHDIPKTSKAEKFATKKLIFYLLDQVMLKTRIYHSHPGFQLYAEIIALKAITNILQTNKDIISPEDNRLAGQTLSVVLRKSFMCPLWDAPIVLASETDYIDEVTSALHSKYLQGLEPVDNSQLPIHKADLMYYLYENDLRLSETKKVTASQFSHYSKSMEELLQQNNWTFSDVTQKMTSPMDPRDSEGWLIPSSGRLGVNFEYSELKGMIVNLSRFSSNIELVFEPATIEKPGVISTDDVLSFMRMDFDDVFPLHFSLDPPDPEKPYHPFQELAVNKKLPRAIQHTLFQTDYLMKSFSVGSDISSEPPFKQRACRDGLTKHLPPNLQEATRSINERSGQKPGMSMSRFWIQADKIFFEMSQTRSRLEFRFGDVDIKVRSHPIIPSHDGNLRDTEEDLDPDSVEAHFAADLTNNYKELGHYFPQYARLYEFGKILAVKMLLRAIAKHEDDTHDLPALLKKFKRSPPTTDTSCYWVPAAIHEEHTSSRFSRCYGGVLFAPQLAEESVARFSPTTLSVPLNPPRTDEEDENSSGALFRRFGDLSLLGDLGLLGDLHTSPANLFHTPLQTVPQKSFEPPPKLHLQASNQSLAQKQTASSYQPKRSSQMPEQTVRVSRPSSSGIQNQSTSVPKHSSQPKTLGHQPQRAIHQSQPHSQSYQQIKSTSGHRDGQPPQQLQHSVNPSPHTAKPFTFRCDAEALQSQKNSAFSDFVFKLAGDKPSDFLQIPSTIMQKISQHVSVLTARIFHQANCSSQKDKQITLQLPKSSCSCSCLTYRCIVSQLLSTESTFQCKGTGKKYEQKDSFVDCNMKDMIYMIELKKTGEQYVGKTCQPLWKRMYQHLTAAYKEYIRPSIKDPETRGLADQIVAAFDNVSSEPDASKKKDLIRLMKDHFKIRALAWFQGSPDTPQEEIESALYVTEARLIDHFHTKSHGLNKNVGRVIDKGTKIDGRIVLNFKSIH